MPFQTLLKTMGFGFGLIARLVRKTDFDFYSNSDFVPFLEPGKRDNKCDVQQNTFVSSLASFCHLAPLCFVAYRKQLPETDVGVRRARCDLQRSCKLQLGFLSNRKQASKTWVSLHIAVGNGTQYFPGRWKSNLTPFSFSRFELGKATSFDHSRRWKPISHTFGFVSRSRRPDSVQFPVRRSSFAFPISVSEPGNKMCNKSKSACLLKPDSSLSSFRKPRVQNAICNKSSELIRDWDIARYPKSHFNSKFSRCSRMAVSTYEAR